MNKKMSVYAALGCMIAAIFFPGFAGASLLPTYSSLLAKRGAASWAPQVLGDSTNSSDPVDSIFNSVGSKDTPYHLAGESDVLGVVTDKQSYASGDVLTLTITGITPNGKIGVNTLNVSDVLSSGSGTQLFSPKTQNANSQGSVTMQGRMFGSADSGAWLIVVADISGSTQSRLRMGVARITVGSPFVKMQGSLADATQGTPYSSSFRLTAPTTSPLTFIIMNLPKGITATVSEAPTSSSTQSSSSGMGNFTMVENTPPVNGGYTVNLKGTPLDSGIYFIMSIVGNSAKPLDFDFLKLKVNASASSVVYPNDDLLSIPVQPDLFDPNTFVGVQMPEGSLSMPQQEMVTSQNVQVEGTDNIWWITDQGLKMKVPTRKIFLSYGNTDESVVILSQEELDQYPNVEYIKLRGTSKVYKLEGNTKRLLSSAAKQNLEVAEEQVAEVNKTEFNYYKTGKTITK